jgi:hypothetical protein
MSYTIEFCGNWVVKHSEGWIAYNATSFEDAIKWVSYSLNAPVRVAIVNPLSI